MESKTNSDDCKRPKPKRPLSAYNLFYRYKRAKIIEAQSNNGAADKEALCQLVNSKSGLENYPSTVGGMTPPDILDKLRRKIIRQALDQQLFAKDRKNRPHRKSSHGFQISFVEMNKIMADGWKWTDEFTKSVFQELAEEGRKIYQGKIHDYNLQEKCRSNYCDITEKTNSKSSPELNLEFKMTEPHVGSPKEVYFGSPETKGLKDTIPVVVENGSTETNSDLSWKPLPEEVRSTSPGTNVSAALSSMVMKNNYSGLDIDPSWEPLPFKDQDPLKKISPHNVFHCSADAITSGIPIPTVAMAPKPGAIFAGYSHSLQEVVRQAKRRRIYSPPNPTYPTCTLASAVVTPPMKKIARHPVLTPATGSFSVFGGSELTSHIASPDLKFFHGFLPLPFNGVAKNHSAYDINEKSSLAGFPREQRLNKNGRNVSADDFMTFITSLGNGI